MYLAFFMWHLWSEKNNFNLTIHKFYSWDEEIKKQKREKYLKGLLENRGLPNQLKQQKEPQQKPPKKSRFNLRSKSFDYP